MEHLGYYHHRENDMAYGWLVLSDGKLTFHKCKFVEINKTAKLPKVITDMQVTPKEVDNAFYDSFVKVSDNHFLALKTIDEQLLLKKMNQQL